jgi:hypothetical protein
MPAQFARPPQQHAANAGGFEKQKQPEPHTLAANSRNIVKHRIWTRMIRNRPRFVTTLLWFLP